MTLNYQDFQYNRTCITNYTDSIDKLIKPQIFDFAIKYEETITDRLVETANYIRNSFDTTIIVGMGGAILNPKSVLTGLQDYNHKFVFIDTLDIKFIHATLDSLNFNKTAVLVISKSGQTLETNAVTGLLISAYAQYGIKEANKHFTFITQNMDNTLARTAGSINATIFAHADTGGRFSTFTNIIALPMLVAGLDYEQFYLGGELILQDVLQNKVNSTAARGGALLAHALQANLMAMNISYNKDLETLLEWQAQLLSESLGKKKKGIAPITAIGPAFQHSLLQLCLEGRDDIYYSVLSAANHNIKFENLKEDEVKINNLHDMQRKAVVKSLQNNYPGRAIILEHLNEKSFGAIMMHSMIEIIIAAFMNEINPYGQPGVEMFKRNMLMNN